MAFPVNLVTVAGVHEAASVGLTGMRYSHSVLLKSCAADRGTIMAGALQFEYRQARW